MQNFDVGWMQEIFLFTKGVDRQRNTGIHVVRIGSQAVAIVPAQGLE